MPAFTTCTPAAQTLTFAANAVAAETVTLGTQVYTWRASVTTTANEVLVGGTVAASAQNLFDAVNLTPAGSGVTYGSLTTKNAMVRASAVTATTVVFQAKAGGIIGNLVPSTETMTQGSFGAAVLAGGVGDPSLALQEILASGQINSDVAQSLRELCNDPAGV